VSTVFDPEETMKLSLFAITPLLAASCFGAAIVLPGGTQTVSATSTTGTSFTYTGTLTQNATLGLVVTGTPSDPCLQNDPTEYCTNPSGVVTVAGVGAGVGQVSTFSGTFNGTTATWDYGALLLEISGVSGPGTVQLFAANGADGLGSGSPAANLTLAPTSLSALGFGAFSVVNPTITFIIADTLYSDNANNFVLTPNTSGVPEPSSVLLIGSGLSALAWLVRRSRR
jgi:hypothetical protein